MTTTPAPNDDLVRELRMRAKNHANRPTRELCERAVAALEAQAKEIEALRSANDALRAAISWIEPPFVDDLTPHQELRFRVNQCVKDAKRTALKGA
ncbi:hypothetical protein PZ895_07765 [Mesorhizobium sp. YIM 152430]|uniref:hypothetical protein n=1 Tax=Mesorhizobium sp. YIM 152430 TaxID=3031761 RepID=UPI0023DAC0B4|nr:hypothetical protein [Mesorhizobium sp. YIM 152430]MDF1599671.1 hypothetical protein [Mesorhizobium sp. YIM 152430]